MHAPDQHLNSLNCSTERFDLAALRCFYSALTSKYFHELSRANGPVGHLRNSLLFRSLKAEPGRARAHLAHTGRCGKREKKDPSPRGAAQLFRCWSNVLFLGFIYASTWINSVYLNAENALGQAHIRTWGRSYKKMPQDFCARPFPERKGVSPMPLQWSVSADAGRM
jgi:hypothetical protein